GYGMFFSLGLGSGFLIAVIVGICVAGLAAVLLERVAFRPLRGASVPVLLLASLAVSLALNVIFQNVISPRPVSIDVPSFLTGTISVLGLNIGAPQVLAGVGSVVL